MLFFKRNLKALPSLNFFENVQEVCISVLDRELYIYFFNTTLLHELARHLLEALTLHTRDTWVKLSKQ